MNIEEKKDDNETLEENATLNTNENEIQEEKKEEEQTNENKLENEQSKEEENKQIEVSKEVINNKQIDNKSTNDFKPRKWLLSILIIITIGIFIFLVYQAVNSFKSMTSNKESWGIFNFMKTFEDVQEQAIDIIDNANEDINETQKSMEKEEFNDKFEYYAGTQRGGLGARDLLDNIIKNNKMQESGRLITFVYGNETTTDPVRIKEIKRTFDEFHDYEVTIDYDEEGYVNKVTIEY